ncbi:MAG TPA: ATP phosphoribosyltransferase regulatory subunit, partial [Blastocatellia bacterium]|nr:ATP phosphoribosyltransferase regulatory subunit [Blastocatellia bacterium]
HRPRPIRLCYSGEVFRYDEPTERAAREFHQLGIEHIGQPSIVADLEVLLIAAEMLTTLGLSDFRISLSHVDFFNGVAATLELNGHDRTQDRTTLRELIDRRNSFALENFLKTAAPKISDANRAAFCQLTQLAGQAEAIEKARKIIVNETSLHAVNHLADVYNTLSELGLAEHFDIDFGDTGGQEYYTGLTFKVYVPGWGVEIGSGGRYDNLISNFGSAEPAVGFSFALDALAGAMVQRKIKLLNEEPELEQLTATKNSYLEAFTRARQLRREQKRIRIN